MEQQEAYLSRSQKSRDLHPIFDKTDTTSNNSQYYQGFQVDTMASAVVVCYLINVKLLAICRIHLVAM